MVPVFWDLCCGEWMDRSNETKLLKLPMLTYTITTISGRPLWFHRFSLWPFWRGPHFFLQPGCFCVYVEYIRHAWLLYQSDCCIRVFWVDFKLHNMSRGLVFCVSLPMLPRWGLILGPEQPVRLNHQGVCPSHSIIIGNDKGVWSSWF